MGTTERVIAIIEFLARNREFCSVAEICTALGISKTTAYRILSAMVHLDWAERNPHSRRYRIGIGVMRVGLAMVSNFDIVTASVPYMFRLRDTTKETAMLTLRVGLERMYIQQVLGMYEILQIVELGKLYPLWNGSPGEVILAHLEEAEIDSVLDNLKNSGIKALASGQALVVEELRKYLGEIREKHFAISMGKRIQGTVAIAAPIFGFNRQVIGAISVGGPATRFTFEVAMQASPSVIEAAKNISMRFGNLEE